MNRDVFGSDAFTGSRSENLAAILRDFDRRGVLYDMIGGTFRYCDERAVLSAEEEVGIDACREGLTEQLCQERGLCIACHVKKACHPHLIGRTPVVTLHLRERYSPRWCASCWRAGRWKDDL